MRMVVIGLLFAAVLIAGLVVVLITQFLPDQQAQAVRTEKEPTVQVLVASDNLRIGDSLVAGKYEWREFPKKGELPGYIVREENQNIESEYASAIVIKEVVKGEPITAGHVYKKDTPGFISVQLPPGKRAVTVKVGATTASGGFILPGDYVDVLLTHGLYAESLKSYFKTNFPDIQGDYIPAVVRRMGLPDVKGVVTETIMTNVRVLALDTKLEKGEGVTIKAGTATLEVSPKQMQIVMTADKIGTLALALRSLRPAVGVSDEDLIIATTDIDSTPLLTRFNNAAFHQGDEEEEGDAGGIDIDVIAQEVLFGGEAPADDAKPAFDLNSIFDKETDDAAEGPAEVAAVPTDVQTPTEIAPLTVETPMEATPMEATPTESTPTESTPTEQPGAVGLPTIGLTSKAGETMESDTTMTGETTMGADGQSLLVEGGSMAEQTEPAAPGREIKIYLGGVDEPDKRKLK